MAAIIPGIAALLGVMALAWINANDQNNQQNQINELNTHQDSICTSVRSKSNIKCFFDKSKKIIHSRKFKNFGCRNIFRFKQLVTLH